MVEYRAAGLRTQAPEQERKGGKWNMEGLRKSLERIGLYADAMLKWLVIGGLVGGVGGMVGALFHLGVSYATEVRLAHPWVLYLLPAGGLVIAGLYKLCKLEGRGTNAVIESVHFGKEVPVLLVPLIFVSTVVTHLVGGSAGREGAALQIGGGIGWQVGGLFWRDERELRVATLCGMSARVTPPCSARPLTAAVFALEVHHVWACCCCMAFVPCLIGGPDGLRHLASLWIRLPPTRFAVLEAFGAGPGWALLQVVVPAGALRPGQHSVLPRAPRTRRSACCGAAGPESATCVRAAGQRVPSSR